MANLPEISDLKRNVYEWQKHAYYQKVKFSVVKSFLMQAFRIQKNYSNIRLGQKCLSMANATAIYRKENYRRKKVLMLTSTIQQNDLKYQTSTKMNGKHIIKLSQSINYMYKKFLMLTSRIQQIHLKY